MNDLTKLAQILDDQCVACAKMLGMEEEKSRALLSGDAQVLLSVVGSQQALLMVQKSLEEKRLALCGGWEYATLRELMDSSQECREVLEPVYKELTKTVAALKKMNSRNQRLLETRLATLHFMSEQLGIGLPNTYAKGVQVRV